MAAMASVETGKATRSGEADSAEGRVVTRAMSLISVTKRGRTHTPLRPMVAATLAIWIGVAQTWPWPMLAYHEMERSAKLGPTNELGRRPLDSGMPMPVGRPRPNCEYQ